MISPILAEAEQRLRAWLTGQAFPLWWEAGADLLEGGFHDALRLSGDPAGAPVPGPARKRARVQARQAFCYAAAQGFGWDGPWRAAMRHGLDFLEARHRGGEGFYRAVAGEAGLDLYDQAFVLLALSAASRAGEASARPTAGALLGRLPRHPLGGFRPLADGAAPEATLEANPNMHLLEAALGWIEAGGGSEWRAVATGQVRLAVERLIDPATGALSEHFGQDWRAPARRSERRVDPGHQFEWAWLLMRWSSLGRDEAAENAALRLIEVGEAAGIDPRRGVAVNLLDGELRPLDRSARLWPQAERLKAALAAGELTGARRFRLMAESAVASLMRYLETPTPGLWRERLRPDGTFLEEPAPASSFYHIVGAVAELARGAG